jgi:quinol monooxygenase YgiN
MYGTIARLQLRPGAEPQLKQQANEIEGLGVPGFVATYVYRSDADPNVAYMAVVFASKEAYLANANSPEQDRRYQQLRALLASDPEWHDGEIVHATGR